VQRNRLRQLETPFGQSLGAVVTLNAVLQGVQPVWLQPLRAFTDELLSEGEVADQLALPAE
jgi:hypothetical protein